MAEKESLPTMSESLVTQCPYCQTRFRLSQEQLSAAAGNVRCGACLKVFNAISIGALESAASSDDTSQPAAGADKKSPNPPDQLLIHDDLEFDDLDLEALGMDDSLIREVNPDPADLELPDPVIPDATAMEFDIEPDADLEPDLFIEFDPELDLEPEADAAPQPESDPYHDLHEDFIATPIQDFGPPAPVEPDDEEAAPEPPAQFAIPLKGSPVRPLRDNAEQSPGRAGDGKPEYVTPKLAWRAPEEPVQEPEPDPESIVPARLKKAPELESEPEPDLGELDIPELHDEPILLEEDPLPHRRRQKTWLWASLSALAALALLAQYVTYNRDFLVHDQRTRPMMETLCLLAGCELPARVDISQMRSSNLTVRSHPEFPNALAIDVILYNRADFAQPFPVLRMSFTDTQGRELSSRRFRPEEYLSGELAGANLMPRQTPIHVGLSMLDPGEQAVSYTLEFQSP